MNRTELFSKFKEEWLSKNESFFGTPSEGESFISKEVFKEYSDKYWNNEETRCDICRKLFENSQVNHMEDFIPYNKNDDRSGFFIGAADDYNVIYGWFHYNGSKRKVFPVFLVPKIIPELQWKAGRAYYIPRSVIERNSNCIGKIDNVVKMPGRFVYDFKKNELKEYKEGYFNSSNLGDLSIKYLKTFCPDFVEGEDNETFIEHLRELPDTTYNDVINYHFYDFNYFFNKILKSIVRINPTVQKPGNLCSIITSTGRKKSNSGASGKMREEEGDCTLILNSENLDIYAISNFRSALYSPLGYNQNFFFKNTELFFDAFKTTTSRNAGRLRTLLDDVTIGPDGLLYKTYPDGTVLNQFEAYKKFFIDGDKSAKTESLSCLSKTFYCCNNDPKRIMMTSKSIGQSIHLDKHVEYDKTTHSILARVVFGDFKGLTNGDAIIISESFAKKTASYKLEKIFIPRTSANYKIFLDCWDEEENKPIKNVTLDEFATLMGYNKNNLNRCHNIRIVETEIINKDYGPEKMRHGVNILIRYDIPVKVGDKFTNLHGCKGTISCIIPDDKMPKLIKKCGVMEPGPFEVIISSYGITKRANVGQILEAYSRMKGIDKEMSPAELFADAKEFSKPLIEFDGELSEKCFGIQEILRLQHLSISHASFSGIDKATNSMVNFGEQENLFLLAHNFKDVQREINQRSPKYYKREENITNIILSKDLIDHENLSFNMELLGVFYSLGFDVDIKNDLSEYEQSFVENDYVNSSDEDDEISDIEYIEDFRCQNYTIENIEDDDD